MKQDTFVKFTSHLGNSFVAPSMWTADDKGDTYSLKSPDQQAIIHAIMFTEKGSGTIDEFKDMLTSGLLPKGATGWLQSEWSPIKLANADAMKRDLVPIPEGNQQWRLYVVHADRFYYAIILNASTPMMQLNGPFYESIVRTFECVH